MEGEVFALLMLLGGVIVWMLSDGDSVDEQMTMESVDLESPKKNPGIAALASFFIPGAGQIYNGQIFKGIVLSILALILAISLILVVTFPILLLVWVYAIYDAHSTATNINEKKAKLRSSTEKS